MGWRVVGAAAVIKSPDPFSCLTPLAAGRRGQTEEACAHRRHAQAYRHPQRHPAHRQPVAHPGTGSMSMSQWQDSRWYRESRLESLRFNFQTGSKRQQQPSSSDRSPQTPCSARAQAADPTVRLAKWLPETSPMESHHRGWSNL